MLAIKFRPKVPATRTNITKKVATVAAGYQTVPVHGPDPDLGPSKDHVNPVDPVHAIVDPCGVNPIETRQTVSIVATSRRWAEVVNLSVIGTTASPMAMITDVEEEAEVAVAVLEPVVVQAAR